MYLILYIEHVIGDFELLYELYSIMKYEARRYGLLHKINLLEWFEKCDELFRPNLTTLLQTLKYKKAMRKLKKCILTSKMYEKEYEFIENLKLFMNKKIKFNLFDMEYCHIIPKCKDYMIVDWKDTDIIHKKVLLINAYRRKLSRECWFKKIKTFQIFEEDLFLLEFVKNKLNLKYFELPKSYYENHLKISNDLNHIFSTI